jgi:hypothetical protein
MVQDAFEPGPDGTYPAFPRDAAGRPLWSDSPATDGKAVDGQTPMPRGLRRQAGMVIDLTPHRPDGQPIDPPVLPPS